MFAEDCNQHLFLFVDYIFMQEQWLLIKQTYAIILANNNEFYPWFFECSPKQVQWSIYLPIYLFSLLKIF